MFSPKNEDRDTFAQRIRHTIEEHTNKTSGIRVFEHGDESTLDENERAILANLKAAHEKWLAEHNETPQNPQNDAFKSVKIRVNR